MTLTASNAAGSNTATQSNYITVRDFTIGGSPSNRSIARGKSTSYKISVGAVNSYSGTVALSVSGVPTGVSATLSNTSVTLPQSKTVTLNITMTASAPRGTYKLTVTGASGSVTRATSVNLQVK